MKYFDNQSLKPKPHYGNSSILTWMYRNGSKYIDYWTWIINTYIIKFTQISNQALILFMVLIWFNFTGNLVNCKVNIFDKYSIYLLGYVSNVMMLLSNFPTYTIFNTLQDWIPQIPFRLSFLISSVSPRISILPFFNDEKSFLLQNRYI